MALMRATTTFHLPGPVTVLVDTLLDDDHPYVRQYPAFFVEASASAFHPIEDAVARPGAKRGSPRRS